MEDQKSVGWGKKKSFLVSFAICFFISGSFCVLRDVWDINELCFHFSPRLEPALGLLFGWIGVLGGVFGSYSALFVFDDFREYTHWYYILNLPLLLAYSIAPYCIFKIRKEEVRLDRSKMLVHFFTVELVTSLLYAILLEGLDYRVGMIRDPAWIRDWGIWAFSAHTIFGTSFGAAALILLQYRMHPGKGIRINERMILYIIGFITLYFSVGILLTNATGSQDMSYTEYYRRVARGCLIVFTSSCFLILIGAYLMSLIEKSALYPLGVLNHTMQRQGDILRQEFIEEGKDDVTLGHPSLLSGEVGILIEAYGHMRQRLVEYFKKTRQMEEEKKKREAEFSVARAISEGMMTELPSDFPGTWNFRIHALVDQAEQAGGGFYDCFYVDEEHLALVMVDIIGNGLAAAMFMATAKMQLRLRAQEGGTPGELYQELEATLAGGYAGLTLHSAWIGMLSLRDGVLRYGAVGQNVPIWRRTNGDFAPLKETEDMRQEDIYQEHQLILQTGDRFLFYNSGVVDTKGEDGMGYGLERLTAQANQHRDCHSRALAEALQADVNAFQSPHCEENNRILMGFGWMEEQKDAEE